MTRLSALALVAVLAVAGFAASPVLAAPPSQTVPMCTDADNDQDVLKDGLDQVQLSRAGQTIASLDIWNGCIKVIYTSASGHSTTAFYDPDTLSLVGGRDPGKQG